MSPIIKWRIKKLRFFPPLKLHEKSKLVLMSTAGLSVPKPSASLSPSSWQCVIKLVFNLSINWIFHDILEFSSEKQLNRYMQLVKSNIKWWKMRQLLKRNMFKSLWKFFFFFFFLTCLNLGSVEGQLHSAWGDWIIVSYIWICLQAWPLSIYIPLDKNFKHSEPIF